MSAQAEYLATLKQNLAHGDSGEHTHRAALQKLVETLLPGVAAVNEAKKIECGAPDFSLRRGKTPLAHIETKDIGTDLSVVEKGKGPHGKQFLRYRNGLPNWILTDYLVFDWFVAGELRKRVSLARLDTSGKLKAESGGAEELDHLLHALVEDNVLTVESARELARRMAGITHLLRELIDQSFESGSTHVKSWLAQWLTSFRETLIPELKPDEFADMFAQTLAYGLFAARIQTARTGKPFSHAEALLAVPKSNPFLRKIFSELAGTEMPEEFGWAVDDLVRLLERADIGKILADFGHETGQNDPIVHFYETFLAAYDPKLREKRGVYYTPEPVVRYIVRSVDSLLKTHFHKPKGLADEKTLILDPATGTATFLYHVIEQIRETMAGQAGAWPGYVREHLLKRIFGFELLMAPYAVAHLKLGLQLEDTGYRFAGGERLGIYLTNTLEEAAKKTERLVAKAISDEADAAVDIKRDKTIMVVVGNPPYSGHSANRSRDAEGRLTFIGGLMEDYKRDIPELSKPAQAKWLQDDYVKFLRFAEWRIDKTGVGIVGFITNHGYLDNPTFRGMRRHLMASFDEITVIDLHGNSKKKEKAPDGTNDENVFDIQQGVALFLAVRRPGESHKAKVRHSELWGTRSEKYAFLNSHLISDTATIDAKPTAPEYLFVPENKKLRAEYDQGSSVRDVFAPNGDPAPGVVSTHDQFAIAFTEKEMASKVGKLIASVNEAEARLYYRLCSTTQWNYSKAVAYLKKMTWMDRVCKILYRPFDVRWTVYESYVLVHRRDRVMQHLIGHDNLALITARSNRSPNPDHFFCTNLISETKAGESTIQSFTFPLYLFDKDHEGGTEQMFASKRLNLSRDFLAKLCGTMNLASTIPDGLPRSISPEAIFHYIYAIFHAPGYRSRYADFLKRDFPRVPLTSSAKLFRALALKGKHLVALHLLKTDEAPQVNNFITGFPITGSNEVERVKYTEHDQRVWINDDQYFSGVPAATWNFHIGGYQVCEKWLKERKGRTLTYDDLQHWQRTVVALTETQRLMLEIDALIPEWPLK